MTGTKISENMKNGKQMRLFFADEHHPPVEVGRTHKQPKLYPLVLKTQQN